jgi:hypothetical protein
MLWEALSGRPLFPNAKPSAILTALLSGRIPRAEAPKGAPWAAPLVDVAARALSVEPDKRLASAFAMAAELRRIVGVKLASPLRVAALVRAGFAEPVRKRREELERGDVAAREPARVQAEETPIEVESLSSRPTPPPPSPSLSTTRPPPPAEGTATAFDSVPVVMSSEPPTQPRVRVADATGGAAISTAIAVPAPPLVPRELVATTDAPLSLPTPTRAEPPATPVSSDLASEAPPGVPSRKRVIVYTAFAVPLVVGLVALLTWLGLRAPAPRDVTAAASAPMTTAPPSASTASAGPKTAPMREAATLAPPEPVAPAATPSSDIPPAPSAAAVSSPPPPITTAKPRPIIKYDPQGI